MARQPYFVALLLGHALARVAHLDDQLPRRQRAIEHDRAAWRCELRRVRDQIGDRAVQQVHWHVRRHEHRQRAHESERLFDRLAQRRVQGYHVCEVFLQRDVLDHLGGVLVVVESQDVMLDKLRQRKSELHVRILRIRQELLDELKQGGQRRLE